MVRVRKRLETLATAIPAGPALRPISPDFVECLLLALGGTDCLLTVAEVDRRLRVSRATVYKLVAEERLAHERIGNSIRFLAESALHGPKPRV